jgi:hypothetical protein
MEIIQIRYIVTLNYYKLIITFCIIFQKIYNKASWLQSTNCFKPTKHIVWISLKTSRVVDAPLLWVRSGHKNVSFSSLTKT